MPLVPAFAVYVTTISDALPGEPSISTMPLAGSVSTLTVTGSVKLRSLERMSRISGTSGCTTNGPSSLVFRSHGEFTLYGEIAAEPGIAGNRRAGVAAAAGWRSNTMYSCTSKPLIVVTLPLPSVDTRSTSWSQPGSSAVARVGSATIGANDTVLVVH